MLYEQKTNWQVPVFNEDVYKARSFKYVLVIPVINEGKRIGNVLEKIFAAGLTEQIDIIIADGGSTDDSLASCFLMKHGVRALLTKTDSGRLSAQLRMGYAWALQSGYQGIITIDGNDKDSVESIPNFIVALEEGIDYAQASRFIKGGRSVNAPFIRLAAIRLIHAPLTSLSARVWLTDTTQGFRAYSSRYLLDYGVQPFRDCFQNYELLAYLAIRASQLGFKVKEIPTERIYPKSGPVPTKISPFHGSLELVKVLFKACTGQYNPRNND